MRKTYKDKNTTFTPLYKNLLAWQIADELAKSVYKTTKTFPKDETYGLTSQLRRATLSVALNIIEGYARNNKNEFRQFLRIALGSLAEATYLLEFALDQNYLSTNAFKEITEKRNRCGQLLWKLFQSQTK
ncbi:MAG: four helix bundle protein [Candidatus Blackburnbacteria bacterium]|nr:four helix bundle protein [Candidatus Blackburnbacteria bacterium]